MQHARYTIEVRLDVATNRVSGSERAVYINDSPDTLRRIAVYLRQNVFAPGSPRRQPAPITGVQRVDVPVDVWLTGARRYVVRAASSPAVVSVDIDPDGLFPDMNRENQVWKR